MAFRWLLNHIITASIVAIPVIFQPELRRALERVGRTGLSTLFGRPPAFTDDELIAQIEGIFERQPEPVMV